MQVNQQVTLAGKSKKGKERVKRDGADGWVITAVRDKVLFNAERGPWLFISKGDERTSRWVRAVGDVDFEVTLATPGSVDPAGMAAEQLAAQA